MAHAEISGALIHVTTQWNEKETIKQIPGTRWNESARCWTLPLSWVACLQLRGVFGTTLTVGDELTKWSWETFIQRVQPAMNLRNLTEPNESESDVMQVINSW